MDEKTIFSKALHSNFSKFVKGIGNTNEIADALFSAGVISKDNKDRIEVTRKDMQKNRLLIYFIYISKIGPSALKIFQNALGDCEMARLLQPSIKAIEMLQGIIEPEEWPPSLASLDAMAKTKVKKCNVSDFAFFHSAKSKDFYQLTRERRGIVLMIHIDKFIVKSKERIGSEKDRDCLINIFRQLHFDIHLYENPDKEKLEKILNTEKKNSELNDIDCFIFVIMSHGTKDSIFTTDNNLIRRDYIFSQFGSEQCPFLKGKPKLFIMQACQIDLDIPEIKPIKDDGENCCITVVPNTNRVLTTYLQSNDRRSQQKKHKEPENPLEIKIPKTFLKGNGGIRTFFATNDAGVSHYSWIEDVGQQEHNPFASTEPTTTRCKAGEPARLECELNINPEKEKVKVWWFTFDSYIEAPGMKQVDKCIWGDNGTKWWLDFPKAMVENGGDYFIYVKTEKGVFSRKITLIVEKKSDEESSAIPPTFKEDDIADCVIIAPTREGYEANRNIERGTFFLQAVAWALINFSHTFTLNEIINWVTRQVLKGVVKKHGNVANLVEATQHLTGSIHFFPGLYLDILGMVKINNYEGKLIKEC